MRVNGQRLNKGGKISLVITHKKNVPGGATPYQVSIPLHTRSQFHKMRRFRSDARESRAMWRRFRSCGSSLCAGNLRTAQTQSYSGVHVPTTDPANAHMEQTEGDERRKWTCCPGTCCQCCCPGILDLLINAGQRFQPDGGTRAPILDSSYSRWNDLSSSGTQTEHQAQPEVGPVLSDYMRRTDLDSPSNSLERQLIARYARRLPSARVVQGHRVVDHQQVERPGPSPYIPCLAEIDDEPDTLR